MTICPDPSVARRQAAVFPPGATYTRPVHPDDAEIDFPRGRHIAGACNAFCPLSCDTCGWFAARSTGE